MLRERGPNLPRLVLYGIGLTCLCVLMFMLGSTMTLWTMQFALDQTDNSMLDGFSLPAMVSDVIPAMPVTPFREQWTGATLNVAEDSLLRPPNQTA